VLRFKIQNLLLVVIFVMGNAISCSAKSIALIIGNDNYENNIVLHNARNDANAYKSYFGQIGFEVATILDADTAEFKRELGEFYDRIVPGDTVVFAYAGHGWSDGKENFLVPTEVSLEDKDSVLKQLTIPLQNGNNGILDEVNRKQPKLVVAIIDACRDNILSAVGKTRGGGQQGLALSQPPSLEMLQAGSGIFVIYSASSGQRANDSFESTGLVNSPFTKLFLEELKKDQELLAAVKATQNLVNEVSGKAGRPQLPAYYDQTVGSICLTGSCSPQLVAQLPAPVVEPVIQPSVKPPKAAVTPNEIAEQELATLLFELNNRNISAERATEIKHLASQAFRNNVGIINNAMHFLPGIRIQDITYSLSDRMGLERSEVLTITDANVDAIDESMPHIGDQIFKANGHQVFNMSGLLYLLNRMQVEDELYLTAKRQGIVVTLKIVNDREGNFAFVPILTNQNPIVLKEPSLEIESADASLKELKGLIDRYLDPNVHGEAVLQRLRKEMLAYFQDSIGVSQRSIFLSPGIKVQDLNTDLMNSLEIETQSSAFITSSNVDGSGKRFPLIADRITWFDGLRISKSIQFETQLFAMNPETSGLLKVHRRGQEFEYTVKLDNQGVYHILPFEKEAYQRSTAENLGAITASTKFRTEQNPEASVYYKFEMPMDGRLRAKFVVIGGRSDYDIELENSLGTIIWKSSKQSSPNKHLNMLLNAGKYYLHVSAPMKQPDGYHLEIATLIAPEVVDFGAEFDFVETHGDWSVYHIEDGRCLMATKAKNLEPWFGWYEAVPIFSISVERNSESIGLIFLTGEDKFEAGSVSGVVRDADGITASIPTRWEGGALKPLTIEGNNKFFQLEDMHKLQAADELEIHGTTPDGDAALVKYSLLGYTKAAIALNKLCDANAIWMLGQQ
jgi:hypothetical protein